MAMSEAQHVLRLIGGHSLTYPVYFDMEDNSTIGSDYAAIAQTFCDTIKMPDMQLVFMPIWIGGIIT